MNKLHDCTCSIALFYFIFFFIIINIKCANLYELLHVNSFGKFFKLSLFSFPISLQLFTI